MSMLVRAKVYLCEAENHYISIWEPGDEERCGVEHVAYGPRGYIICYEDHNVDIDQTVADLTGGRIGCFEYTEPSAINGSFNRLTSDDYYEDWDSNLIIFDTCLGADVSVHNNRALRYAAYTNNHLLARLLLEHGADVHALKEEALCKAAERGYIKIVKLLLQYHADASANESAAVRFAAIGDHAEIIQLLLDHGASVSDYEYAALRYAQSANNLKSVRVIKAHIAKQKEERHRG